MVGQAITGADDHFPALLTTFPTLRNMNLMHLPLVCKKEISV
jgi:hypothetical protein